MKAKESVRAVEHQQFSSQRESYEAPELIEYGRLSGIPLGISTSITGIG